LVPEGFTVLKHELNLYGLCAQCAINTEETKLA
jgi:Fe2+ or Zn2+ uptake regulation protein